MPAHDRQSLIRNIHAAKSALNLPDDKYRAWLLASFRVHSSTLLSDTDLGQAAWELRKRAIASGAWVDPRKKFGDVANREGMATPKQLRLIEGLWRDRSKMEGHTAREVALTNFLRHHFHRDSLLALTMEDVRVVVNALEHMPVIRYR